MKSTTREIQDWVWGDHPPQMPSGVLGWEHLDVSSDKPIEIPSDKQAPGTKYDQGKLQYTLIPPYAMQEVARNLTEGLKKYKERDNWQKVQGAEERYMDALMRHFEAIRRGETHDLDSSDPTISHMSAVAVNAMFLLEFMYNPKLNNKE